MNVTVIGTGYVGLTTGAALAYLGHRVTCVDKDPAKLELLCRGKSPVHEQGLEELMSLAGRNLNFAHRIQEAVKDAEVILVAVGTPAKSNGEADTQYVEAAAREVAEGLKKGRLHCLAVKSTVPVGTNRRVSQVVRRVLEARGVGDKTTILVVSNPEFLREGRALHCTFYPDRIVVGAEQPEGVDMLRRLYQRILEQTFDPPPFLPRPEGYSLPPLVSTDPTSAEMIKYASNAFLALKISFINEIAGLCEKVGADVTEVARGMGLDPRIGSGFLAAGLGWGGSCFPKDTAALLAMAEEHAYTMPIVSASREVNSRQRYRIVEKLQETLKGVRGRVIGVLGLAFKPGTDDVRESPALDVVRILVERGAHVRVHDPVAMDNARRALEGLEVEFFRDPYALVSGAEALVLATEWPEYRHLDLARLAGTMCTPVLLDGRNLFDPEEARRAGWTYMGIGRWA
ncbi:UDPglucose 6-dehydrogenase [Desulfofundulus thermosubterraneus DSM 16057]|uniref:UDP-glucose 6-dehydrogenase n=2 Tax=Desulfofundulus TaxID=2282741 RepID=A0A1M6FUC5_9FIRM|nr:UDPglucose 6-dehydrogenase [Desulfofundulus thermosubterraneus DSM 16057]